MSSRFLAATVAAVLLASPLLANGPRPPQPVPLPPITSADTKIFVFIDAKATRPVLRVPVALVQARQQVPPKPEGSALLGTPTTVVAGLALACAFVTGGFWLLRGKGGRAAAAVVCLVCLAFAGGTVWADIAFPPRPEPLPAFPLPGNVPLTSDVTIQVVARTPSNGIELVIPPQKQQPEKGPQQTPPPPRPE